MQTDRWLHEEKEEEAFYPLLHYYNLSLVSWPYSGSFLRFLLHKKFVSFTED